MLECCLWVNSAVQTEESHPKFRLNQQGLIVVAVVLLALGAPAMAVMLSWKRVFPSPQQEQVPSALDEGLRSALTQVTEKSLPLAPLSLGKSQISLEAKDVASAQATVLGVARDLNVTALVTEDSTERKVFLISFQPGQVEAFTAKLKDSGAIAFKTMDMALGAGLTEVVVTAAP